MYFAIYHYDRKKQFFKPLGIMVACEEQGEKICMRAVGRYYFEVGETDATENDLYERPE